MTDDKKLIVYLAKYDNQNFWAYISNFFHKFCRKSAMEKCDVDRIFTRVVPYYRDNRRLVKEILVSKDSFRSIAKPENMYAVNEVYVNLFCIYIDIAKVSDIVELQKLYLICRKFEDKRILVVIEGTDNNYHRISRLLKWVNMQNETFFNRVYYRVTQGKNKGNVKKLVQERAAVFEKLLPILEIDEETDNLLRTSLRELVQDGEIETALDGKDIKVGKVDLKNSALSLISDRKAAFKDCERHQLVDVLEQMNLLTFILFADSLNLKKKTYMSTAEVREDISVLSRHVQGYLQLTENILFHTRDKVGVFCLRLLEGDARYLQDKYTIPEKDKNHMYFEVTVSDYTGNEENGNLAQTFLENISDQSLRQSFRALKPIHFFQNAEEMDKQTQQAWERYYSDVENVGKHYGLKIFQTLVAQAGGRFVVESHSAHKAAKGECIGGAMEGELCMPGTSYSILMPMHFERQRISGLEQDFGVSNAVSYETDINKISSVKTCYHGGDKLKNAYNNEMEKYALVDEITDLLSQKSKNDIVIAVNAAGVSGRNAELVYKALIKAAADVNDQKYVAFYNCTVEFVREIWIIAYSLFETMAVQYILRGRKLQIAFYTQNDYEEMLIIPNDYRLTLQLNRQINFTRETKWKDLFEKPNSQIKEFQDVMAETADRLLPFDVMISPGVRKKLTIFEHYARRIINRDIQREALGCRLRDTHMRLGSTIHVGGFYEAEFLFGINLFVERFALLMALDLRDRLSEVNNLTLYGYASYSEQLIYKLRDYIQKAYEGVNIDYAILERETQEHGTKHTDIIRYNTYFEDDNMRKAYFEDRKIVCIVPISSTLKTNERMINLFCEQNGEVCRNNILEDYEVILVGNSKNDYWNVTGKKRIKSRRVNSLKLNPRFFIRFNKEYEESLKCGMCFPEKALDEIPLIEVNAASTIPNQAFGVRRTKKDMQTCTLDQIQDLEKEMRLLKDCFLYSHTKNGEAHFLFYVQTNLVMIKRRNEITKWLRRIKDKIALEKEVYNIIFCPTHARNVGFAECINEVVFDSSAIIIHDDIDKEYRSNFFTKYSNIYLFVKKVMEEEPKNEIRFFYADDMVITGRSFQRAKSLLKSIVQEFFHDDRKEYCIFESIFVLIDRNSQDNKKMYVGNEWEKHFFSFCTIHVSSLRTHGDACVLCNLENDANRLKESSVSMDMYKYWEEQKKKFTPDDVERFVEGEEYKDKDKRERAFRRLLCANEAGVFLSEKYHGNRKESAMICILQMIINGCSRPYDRKEYCDRDTVQREFFLSYCKILSRPFIVFNKAVKEAVFDFLLIFAESILTGREVLHVVAEVDHKNYLQNETTTLLLTECEKLVESAFSIHNKNMELLKVLLKQLTELKSNYVIRLENINKIAEYIKNIPTGEQSDFYERYMTQVKRLLGVSSDTSKSTWFDYLLSCKKEYNGADAAEINLPRAVYEQLYLENNRVSWDAVLKLSKIIQFSEEERTIFSKKNFIDSSVVRQQDYANMSIMEKINSKPVYEEEERIFQDIGKKITDALASYSLKDYYEVLKTHGYKDMQDREYMLPIAAQILLYQYIDENFGYNQSEGDNEKSEERKGSLAEHGKQIAIYLNYILQAKKTYILVESISEANAWEDVIVEKFNRLVCQKKCEVEMLKPKKMKEYLQLGSSLDTNRNMVFSNWELAGYLKNICNSEEFKKRGYNFLQEKKILIWRLGIEESQVYVCSELEDGRTPIEYLHNIRNALQFSYQMNSRVFNVNNTAFFTELVAAANNLRYSLGKKVVTHTPYMIRMQQYLQLQKNVSEEERKTDIMMLLADLNISEHYRASLHKEYYIREVDFKKVRWGEENPVFTGQFPLEFKVPLGELEKRTKVIVRNEGFSYTDKEKIEHVEKPVSPEDELICYHVANASREVILMLYLLITNSAVEGRSEIQDGSIDVFLSKTADGELRISNKLSKSYKKEGKDSVLEIPPYDDDGISIWTVSRYLKSFAATILNRKMLQIEKKLSDICEKEMQILRTEVEQLSEAVRVHIDYVKREGEEYFSIVIPIFAEKYKELF